MLELRYTRIDTFLKILIMKTTSKIKTGENMAKGKSPKPSTLYVASYMINDDEKKELRGVNKAQLVDLVRKTIREEAGLDGSGYFELCKIYTEEERCKLSIPDNVRGIVDQRTRLTNGRWSVETPFKEYF